MEPIGCVRVWKVSSNFLCAIGDNSGLLIVICTPSQHSLVLDMVGVAGWRENHNIVTLCATPHFKDDELTKCSLFICVFAKPNVKHNFTIPHPFYDTWCDRLREDEWTMEEGQPLRGKHFS